MFELQPPTENYRAYSPSSASDDGESRSGSQSPSALASSNSRKRRAQLSRIPLTSSTSTDSTGEGGSAATAPAFDSTAASAAGAELPPGDVRDKRIRLASSSSTTSTSSLFSSTVADSYDLADLEPTPSAKLCPLARGGTLIGEGDEFELVGDGEECRAVHVRSRTIHHCQAMKQDVFSQFLAVAERLEAAKHRLTMAEHSELRRLLMPQETRVIRGERGLYYVISPDHQGSLYTISRTENSSATARSVESPWSEAQGRAIFAQIVRLVTLCHKIGVYLRDFRLQKIVYTDRDKDLIRFLHDRNVYVAPLLEDDTVSQVHTRCCPAYTAPEILHRVGKQYRAQPADIWSLGVLLFVLLTGRYPFYEERPVLLARSIRMCQFAFKSTDRVSRPARLLVHSLLRLNPNERPTADLVATADWLREADAFKPSPPNRNGPKVRVFVSHSVQAEADSTLHIPQPLLRLLLQPVAARNAAYASVQRSELVPAMETLINGLQRSPNVPSRPEDHDQTVPEAPTGEELEWDSLGIAVVRVAPSRQPRVYRD